MAENGTQMDFLITVNTYITNKVAGKWSMTFIESHRLGYPRSHSPSSRLCVLKAGLGTLFLLDAAAPGWRLSEGKADISGREGNRKQWRRNMGQCHAPNHLLNITVSTLCKHYLTLPGETTGREVFPSCDYDEGRLHVGGRCLLVTNLRQHHFSYAKILFLDICHALLF